MLGAKLASESLLRMLLSSGYQINQLEDPWIERIVTKAIFLFKCFQRQEKFHMREAIKLRVLKVTWEGDRWRTQIV
jgi:hypothetical protein